MQNNITKEPIFDLDLDQLGYIYMMEFESSEGYALVINSSGIFEVAEIYLDASSPYEGYSGEKVYVNFLVYLVWNGDDFIETESGLLVSEDIITELSNSAFYSSDYPLYFSQETIYYTNRVQNEHGLAKRHPAYLPVGISNGCTPTAGANIIGYYTRYYQELIPGFTPGSYMANYYLYKEMPSESAPVIQTLYNYMGTNTMEPGTTITNFRNGMIRYCNEKGRNISFDTCMQYGSFNFNVAKQRFDAGLPAALFVDTFTVGTLSNASNDEIVKYLIGTVCHAMAGFGYKEITYTLTNGQIRADKYIAVATGLADQTKGYFNINYNTIIDEFYSINIY